MKKLVALLVSLCCITTDNIYAANRNLGDSPQAHLRSNQQNYKDRVLAMCIASAYEKEVNAAKDASETASVLVEWLDYDAENSGKEMTDLVAQYMKRDYRYPLPQEYKNAQFKLLKCFDLYHSKELQKQVKRFVKKSQR